MTHRMHHDNQGHVFNSGVDARTRGRTLNDCPYHDLDSDEAAQWTEGFLSMGCRPLD